MLSAKLIECQPFGAIGIREPEQITGLAPEAWWNGGTNYLVSRCLELQIQIDLGNYPQMCRSSDKGGNTCNSETISSLVYTHPM